MKKLFALMAFAGLVLAGCDPDPKTPDDPDVDDVVTVIADSEDMLGNEGGSYKVTVYSSGEWTISGGESWAVPSADKGADGDVIEFTVEPNTTDDVLEATFTFTCGTATDDITIKVDARPAMTFNLVTATDAIKSISSAKQTIKFEIDTDSQVDEAAITSKVNIVSGTGEWVKYTSKSNPGYVTVVFDVEANATFEERKATLTIASDGTEEPRKTITIELTQAPADRLEFSASLYDAPMGGGTVEVTVTANIPYELTIEGNTWVSQTANNGDVYTFTAQALTVETRRSVTITATPTGESTLEPVTAIIRQKDPSVIDKVADLSRNAIKGIWTNAAPLKDLGEFTLETLVWADHWGKTSVDGSTSQVNMIMGLESWFVIRVGDSGYPKDQLQVVYKPSGAVDVQGVGEFKIGNGNVANAALKLSEKTWHHIAVTYSVANAEMKAYIDGADTGVAITAPGNATLATNIAPVNFGTYNAVETGAKGGRNFYVNHAYESTLTRYTMGRFAEIRIWNKVLTATEIAAEGHFYNVPDPASDANLVGYWKMDEAEGDTFIDYSASGNNLPSWSPVNWVSIDNGITVGQP